MVILSVTKRIWSDKEALSNYVVLKTTEELYMRGALGGLNNNQVRDIFRNF